MQKWVKKNFTKQLNKWKIAFGGIHTVLQNPKYSTLSLFIFAIFAWFLTLTRESNSGLALLFSRLSFGDKLSFAADNFVQIFRNLIILDGILIFILSVLQGIVLAMVVYEFRHTKTRKKLDETATNESLIATILTVLVAGCPTCGTAILMPVFLSLFAGAAASVFSTISFIVVIVAIILLLFALKRLGFIMNLKYKK